MGTALSHHGVGLAGLIHSVTTNHIMKKRRNVSFGMFRSEYSFQSNSAAALRVAVVALAFHSGCYCCAS